MVISGGLSFHDKSTEGPRAFYMYCLGMSRFNYEGDVITAYVTYPILRPAQAG